MGITAGPSGVGAAGEELVEMQTAPGAGQRRSVILGTGGGAGEGAGAAEYHYPL